MHEWSSRTWYARDTVMHFILFRCLQILTSWKRSAREFKLTDSVIIYIVITNDVKKLKLSHYKPLSCLEERRYSTCSFSTSALDGGEWSVSRPGRALPPGKGPPVPIAQEAGWDPEPVWIQRLEEKSVWLCRGSNFDHPVVHPVADTILAELPSSQMMLVITYIYW
jgi:hypothetical protein